MKLLPGEPLLVGGVDRPAVGKQTDPGVLSVVESKDDHIGLSFPEAAPRFAAETGSKRTS